MARTARSDLPGARAALAGAPSPAGGAPPLLDDARSLARPAMELVRAGPCVRCGRHDRARLAGRAHRRLRRAAARPVVRECREAAGQGPQGLCGRQRHLARLARHPRRRELESHPKVGASWEGFAIEQVRVQLGARPEECFHWGTHGGAELDLLVVRGRTRRAFEIKRTSAPSVTSSMRTALADLDLPRLDVIHAGADTYLLSDRVRAVAMSRILQDLEPLR